MNTRTRPALSTGISARGRALNPRDPDARASNAAPSADAEARRSGVLLQAPHGMADLLPPEAAARRALTRRVLHSFELCGYELVTPPIIERAEVIERGSGVLESRELVRFVEPESGEVVVLRPDITPQIARMAASRLAEHPAPLRLCYEGRVFRRQHGRARNQQQIAQAGVELIGAAGVRADVEIISLAIRACEEAGVTDFCVELSDIRLVRSLLETVPPAARDEVSALIAQKDGARLRELARSGALSDESADALADLIALYGTADVLDEAGRRFRARSGRAPSQAALALENLRDLTRALEAFGFGPRIVFDLSETRGLSYYTGMRFSILASGPGEAIGGGGRYDSLLTRFGWDAPATGFAIDLGNLEWTLRAAGRGPHDGGEVRAVVAGRDAAQVREVAERLRGADMVAATLDDSDRARCLAFAKAWGYDVVLLASASGCDVLRAQASSDRDSQQRRTLSDADLDTIRRLSGGANRANKR